MEIQKMKEQLIEWVEQMKHGYRDSDLYLYEEFHPTGVNIRVELYTRTNIYSIVAHLNDRGGYLGCIGNSRTPRAGESWTRGSDLADGDFSKETWIKILGDIVGYELVKIHRPVKCLFEEIENGEIK